MFKHSKIRQAGLILFATTLILILPNLTKVHWVTLDPHAPFCSIRLAVFGSSCRDIAYSGPVAGAAVLPGIFPVS